MVGSGGNKQQIIGGGAKYLTVDVIICLTADKQQQLAMVVDMVKVHAFAGVFDPFVGDLRDLFADDDLKHSIPSFFFGIVA